MSTRGALLAFLWCASFGCDDGNLGRGDSGVVDVGSDGTADAGLIDGDEDGFRSDVDCDDTDPTVGAVATRTCDGDCSEFIVQCTSGVWEDCPDDCDCEPGVMRELLCPMCATQQQTCGVDGRWEAPGPCSGGGECLAISTEIGGACGRCGTSERRCNATCMWEEYECIEDAATCNAWLLRPAAREWEQWRLTSGGPADVQAAWFIEPPTDRVWVLSEGLHVLDPACMNGAGPATDCWVENGERATYLDANITEPLFWGLAIPRSAVGTSNQFLDAFSADWSHRFSRGVFTTTVERLLMDPAQAFTDPEAPPSAEGVRGTFGRVGDDEAWVTVGCAGGRPPTDYIAYIGPSAVHLFAADGSGCWPPAVTYASFPPFALPGAPPLDRIDAATYGERTGLLVLADP